MADYTNRIVVDTASAVDSVSRLDKGLKAANESLDVGRRAEFEVIPSRPGSRGGFAWVGPSDLLFVPLVANELAVA